MPNRVVTEIRPDPVRVGTAVEREVEVAAEALPGVKLKRRLFALGVVAKFVPVIVTGVPIAPIAGVKPPIVGVAWFPTVNIFALVSKPDGVVTLIGPVVAPEGTEATILVAVAETTAPARPLNPTMF